MKVLPVVLALLLLAPAAASAQVLPKPALRFIGTEDYTTASGAFRRYKLVVDNEYEFDKAFFAPSPDLPPCGRNTQAARAWVDVYAGEKRLYGFCALASPAGLRELWFAVPQGEAPPPRVRIVVWDRKTDAKTASNEVATAPPAKPSPAAKRY